MGLFGKKPGLFNIVGASLIGGAILAGSGAGIWYSVTHVQWGSEYGGTNSYRIKLQATTSTDDNSLSKTAKNFSSYLKYRGIETYNSVYYEKASDGDYLNFSLPIERRIPTNDINNTDDLENVPGTQTLFENLNSNNISFVVDLDTSDANNAYLDDSSSKSRSDIFTIDNLTDTDSSIVTPDSNNKQVVVKIGNDGKQGKLITSDNFQEFYKGQIKKQSDSASLGDDPDPAPEFTPEIYIIRDKDSLISRMHYILNCYAAYKLTYGSTNTPDAYKYYDYTKGYYFLTQDETDWAQAVFKQVGANLGSTTSFLSGSLFDTGGDVISPYAKDPVAFFNDTSLDTPKQYAENTPAGNGYSGTNNTFYDSSVWNPAGDNDYNNNDAAFYRLIDCARDATAYENNSNANINKLQGLAGADGKSYLNDYGWKWMEPYVVGIVNKENFTKYFPDKNPLNTSEKAKPENIGKWLVLGDNGATGFKSYTSYEADMIKHSLLKNDSFALPLPFETIRETASPAKNSANQYSDNTFFYNLADCGNNGGKMSSISVYERTMSNGWTISNPIIGLIVILSLIVLAVGVLVSVLYRIPGALFFATLMGSVTLTMFILVFSGKIISLAVILGVIAGVILSVASLFSVMQRMKKHISKEDFVLNGAKKGALKGIWQVVDIHIVSIIVGACFLYFGTIFSSEFGLTLILYSLLSFAFFIIWALNSLLLFIHKQNAQKTNYVFNKKYLPDYEYTQSNENASETTFTTCNKYAKFNLFGFKKEIISGAVILLLIGLGLTLLFTVGIPNAYELFGGSRISILAGNGNDPQSILNQLNALDIPIKQILKQDNFWIVFTTMNYETLLSKVSGISGMGSTWYAQAVENVSTNGDIKQLIIATLIMSGFLSAYAFVRLNWTSIVPVFVSVTLAPLLLISLVGIFQFTINSSTISFYFLFCAINAIFTFVFVGNINNKWIKQKFHSYKDLKAIINNEIKSNIFQYYIYLVGAIVGILLICLFFISTSAIISVLFTLFGVIVSLVILATATKSILIWFIYARYKYKIAVSQNNIFFKKNYDAFDEESIEGINKHKVNKINL